MEPACIEDIHIPMSVRIPLEEVRMLSDRDHIKHVLYYALYRQILLVGWCVSYTTRIYMQQAPGRFYYYMSTAWESNALPGTPNDT